MSALKDLVDGLAGGQIEIIDLTARSRADDPGHPAAPHVRPDSALRARGDQQLRRPWPGLVLEQLPQRRAHRHPLRRPEPLGHRQGPRRRRVVPVNRLIRPAVVLDFSERVRREPRLPPRDRRHRGVGGRQRPAARRRLDDLPHRLGRAVQLQEEFINADDNGPHTPGMTVECARWIAEESHWSGSVSRRSARTPARRTRRPGLPVPLLPHGQRQVRAHPAAERRPAAHQRERSSSPDRCRSSPGPAPPHASTPSSSAEPPHALRGRHGGCWQILDPRH